MKQKKWSFEDINQLIKLYPDNRNEDIAKIMNISIGSIKAKSYSLKLRKTSAFISKMVAKRNKMVGRDLTLELLCEIALEYKTRGEFQKKDPGAYSSARRQGFLSEICKHMPIIQFSIPQLILKDIMDSLLGSKSLYNDRQTIKPYEIDIYYPEFKLAFEYQGRGWHKNNNTDLIKLDIFKEKKINIFYIVENNRNYEEDIKNQICSNLNEINKICNTSIKNKEVLAYIVKYIYTTLYNTEELINIAKKYNSFKIFIKNEKSVYYKLKKIKKIDEATIHMKDRRIHHTINSLKKEIDGCVSIGDLIKKNKGAYLHIRRNNLEYLIQHLKDGRKK